MRDIAVAQPVGDALYRQTVIEQQQLGMADNEIGEILSWRQTIDLPEGAVAVVGAVAEPGRDLLDAASSAAGCRCREDGFLQ